MKKFFALALAVAMVMSMAAVSFAAFDAANGTSSLDLVGPFDYSADDDLMRDSGLKYGDSVYYAILIDEKLVSDYKAVEKLKVKTTFEMGEELVEEVSVVKKAAAKSVVKNGAEKVSPVFAAECTEDFGYYYFVAIKTVAKETTGDADIIGTFEFNRKDVDDIAGDLEKVDADLEGEIDEVEVDFAVNIFYDGTDYFGTDYEKTSLNNISDDIVLDWDESYVLKFDCDDEIEIAFGTDPNEGTFTVDVSGQGKVFVKWNTKADEAIVAANPGAKMHFVNFNNVKWNRTGEFMYEMEDGVACYKVVDGALVEIPGAEYDAADEAFYFNTRVLGNYVFADAELVNSVVEAPVVEAPAVTNPTTGA